MKKYISAAKKQSYNKDELLNSIYYLFNQAEQSAGVSSEDVEITKISVSNYASRGTAYVVKVNYMYQNKPAYISLFNVPTNSNIPEDYWVTSTSTQKRSYLDELVYALDTSKIDMAKQAFDEFCNTVNSIGTEYGLTFECHPYPRNIDDLSPTNTFILFYADLVKVECDDPNIELTEYIKRYGKAVFTDNLSKRSVSIYWPDFSIIYLIDKDSFTEEINDQSYPTAEPIVHKYMEQYKSMLDTVVERLETAEEYLDRQFEIAKLFESIPGITVEYSNNVDYNPRSSFKISGPFGTKIITIEDIFEADDKKLIKNLKARIRRYNSAPPVDPSIASGPNVLFKKEWLYG